jgi:hypothetical protein
MCNHTPLTKTRNKIPIQLRPPIKSEKVALVTVMRKLLVLAYGVLKSGKSFDINYQQQAD